MGLKLKRRSLTLLQYFSHSSTLGATSRKHIIGNNAQYNSIPRDGPNYDPCAFGFQFLFAFLALSLASIEKKYMQS